MPFAYKHTEAALGFVAYLVPVAIVWFFVVQHGAPTTTPFAFWLIGSFWSLLLVITLSYAEGQHMKTQTLIVTGFLLIILGTVAAGLAVLFVAGDAEKFIFSNLLLLTSAGIGTNFLAQGLVERGKERQAGNARNAT